MGNREKRNLGKYDAPLIIQFRKGAEDFQKGRLNSPFHQDTMQYREWNRGFNKAYFDRLKRVQKYELKARSRSMAEKKAHIHAT